MIAEGVKTIDIPSVHCHVAKWRGTEFLVEYPETQMLAGLDLVRPASEAQQQFALFNSNIRNGLQPLSLPVAFCHRSCAPQS